METLTNNPMIVHWILIILAILGLVRIWNKYMDWIEQREAEELEEKNRFKIDTDSWQDDFFPPINSN